MQRQTQLNEVYAHPFVQKMIEADPVLRELMLISSVKTNITERWEAYEALKRHVFSSQVLKPLLKTTEHYQTMIWALDLLLPDGADGERGE